AAAPVQAKKPYPRNSSAESSAMATRNVISMWPPCVRLPRGPYHPAWSAKSKAAPRQRGSAAVARVDLFQVVLVPVELQVDHIRHLVLVEAHAAIERLLVFGRQALVEHDRRGDRNDVGRLVLGVIGHVLALEREGLAGDFVGNGLAAGVDRRI